VTKFAVTRISRICAPIVLSIVDQLSSPSSAAARARAIISYFVALNGEPQHTSPKFISDVIR
jgi:hypothetical protein